MPEFIHRSIVARKKCVTIVPRHESSGESFVEREKAPIEQDAATAFVLLLFDTGSPVARILTTMSDQPLDRGMTVNRAH